MDLGGFEFFEKGKLRRNLGLWCFTWLAISTTMVCVRAQEPAVAAVRVAIIGLTHGHGPRMVGRILARSEFQLVGIVEPRSAARVICQDRFNLDTALFYDDLAALSASTWVDAAVVMTSTYEHARAVADCASHGIHVMVEKPLAVNVTQAQQIARDAEAGGIHVLVNYEPVWTPWYQELHARVTERREIGLIRRLVAHDGHGGPVKIGSPPLFREWLTDPHLNGGGALFDFGCYGVAVMTWLLDGERPMAVMASTRQLQPEDYPNVDDDATLLLEYESAQGLVQASWNWPFPRKDVEVYGTKGYASANALGKELIVRPVGSSALRVVESPQVQSAKSDPLSYLAAVVRGDLEPTGPASLSVNLIVAEVLEAAQLSVREGRRIELSRSK